MKIKKWRYYYMTKKEFQLNTDYLHSDGDSLIECEDYIPLHLSIYYNKEKRDKFLKKKGILKKIQDIEWSKREELDKSKDKIEWIKKDILDFVDEHKEYSDILK